MKTQLATLAFIAIATLSAGAHAADNKSISIESWSFGCTSPAMTTQPGGAPEARTSYDLKAAKGTRVANSTSACTSPQGAPAPQVLRESPSKASTGRSKELTGHVTLIK